MKRILPSLFILLIAFTSSTASHKIAGIQLDYEALGNDKYSVFIHVIRQCDGPALPAQDLVALCSSSTVTVLAANQTLVSKTRLGACQDSICSGSLEFEEWIWKVDLDLSGYSCCEWTLTYTNDYRDGGQTYFITSSLNKCAGEFGAKFQAKPKMLLGHNQDQELNFSIQATSNIDSISYELVTGLIGINNSMTYSGSYGPNRPMNFFGFPNQTLQYPAGFHMLQNGQLRFRPTQANQLGTLVIRAVLWMDINGTMTQVGDVCSDIEVTVLSVSGNNAPEITGRASLPAFDTLYYCAGETANLSFLSSDPDNDSTYVEFIFTDSLIQTSTSYNKGKQAELQLILSSPASDSANTQGRQLRFKLFDEKCPLPREEEYNWVFMPVKKPKAQFYSLENCQQVSVAVQVIEQGYPSAKAWYRLYDDKDVLLDSSLQINFSSILQPGYYRLETGFGEYGTCSDDTMFNYAVLPHFDFQWMGRDSACREDTLSWELKNLGNSTFTYTWKNVSQGGNSGILSAQNRAKLFPDSSTNIELSVEDSAGCIVPYLRQAAIFQKPSYQLSDTVIRCGGINAWIGPSQVMNMTRLRWTDGDSSIVKQVNSTGWYGFEMENTGFCKLQDSSYVGPVSGLFIKQKFNDITVCKFDSISIPYAGGIGAVTTRFNGSIQNTYQAKVNEQIQVLVADTYGCLDSFSFNLWVPKKPILNFFPRSEIEVCVGESAYLQIFDIPKLALIAWTDSATNQTDRYLPKGLYEVLLIDSAGCRHEYQIRVSELASPNASFTAIINDSVGFYPQVLVGSHSWDFGDGLGSNQTSPKHVYTQEGTYTVIHQLSDDQSCTSSDSLEITILGLLGRNAAKISCYPNPFYQTFQVHNAAGAQLKLFDVVGQEIQIEIEVFGNDLRVFVPENVAPGNYVLLLHDQQGNRTSLVQKIGR